MKNEQNGPRLVPVALVVGLLVASCSFFKPPMPFNNPFDPNQDVASGIASRTITVDGSTADWGDILPAKVDERGDTNNPALNPTGIDIASFYLAKDSTYLYFRLDFWETPILPDANYNFSFWPTTGGAGAHIDCGYSQTWGYNADFNHYDADGNFLYTDGTADVLVSSGTAIEGRIALSDLAQVPSPAMSFNSNYFDNVSGESTGDWSGDYDLPL